MRVFARMLASGDAHNCKHLSRVLLPNVIQGRLVWRVAGAALWLQSLLNLGQAHSSKHRYTRCVCLRNVPVKFVCSCISHTLCVYLSPPPTRNWLSTV